MKISTFTKQAVLTTALLSASAGSAIAATTYSVQSRASLFGDITLLAINPDGIAVGRSSYSVDDTNRDVAVLWTADGTFQELIPGTESGSRAFDINTSGQVLIYADGGFIYGQGIPVAKGAYLWQAGVITPVNLSVQLDLYSTKLALNDTAQIMGTADFVTPSGTQKHAFLATNGLAQDLGTLPGGTSSSAQGINNNGDVVGYSYDASNQQRAVLWRNGSIIDLGVLPGASSSIAHDINDNGLVVGSSGGRLFTWKDGVMTDLGKFSSDTNASAQSINNNGDITGSANFPGTYKYASFKWSQGVFSALDPVIQNGACTASDINDAGQINMNCLYGSFTTSNFVISPTTAAVDLGVLSSINQSPVAGDPLVFNLDVYNVGSLNASNVQLTTPLPTNSSFFSATTSQGACSGSAVISCALGDLASGAKAAVKVTVIPLVAGSVNSNVSVNASESESNTPNNSASKSVYAFPGGTDLAVSMTTTATTISRYSNVTFTILVENYGPGIANNAVMTDTLPSFLKLVSVSTTSGTCSGTTTVSCNFGTMAKGASATVKVVAQGIRRGSGINTAKVSTTSTDKYAGNNSFGYSIAVK